MNNVLIISQWFHGYVRVWSLIVSEQCCSRTNNDDSVNPAVCPTWLNYVLPVARVLHLLMSFLCLDTVTLLHIHFVRPISRIGQNLTPTLFYVGRHYCVSLILLGVVRLDRESELIPVSCRIHSSVWFISSVVLPLGGQQVECLNCSFSSATKDSTWSQPRNKGLTLRNNWSFS